jgi:hypothetical protein
MRKNSKEIFAKKNRVVTYSDCTRKSDMELADNLTTSVVRLVLDKAVLLLSGQTMRPLQPQPYNVITALFAFYIRCLNKH